MARKNVYLFEPRPVQEDIFESLKRFNVIVMHRRGGKTVLCVNVLIRAALENKRENQRYAYIAPLFRQAKQVAWDYLKEYCDPIEGRRFYENDLRVDLPNGSRIQLFGADNPDALRGIYLDGVIMDEYAQMRPGLWGSVIRPLLTDRQGFGIFIGTPQGHNEFYDLYISARDGFLQDDGTRDQDDTWKAFMYKSSETGVLDADELKSARREMSAAEYEQEFECSFEAQIRGAYYADLMAEAEAEGRIGEVPYDKAVPVNTAWDIGIGDSTAIWFFQNVGQEIHFIDYYEDSGKPLSDYVLELQERDFVYNEHLLPHDIRARELISGKSREEVLQELLNYKCRIVESHGVDDGIQNVRNTFAKCWFDRSRTSRGVEALRQYRREFDTSKNVFKSRPLHNWACFTGDTDILTRHGMRQMIDLPETGEVWTQCGWKQYQNLGVTRKNARLVEVAFTDGTTVRCTPDHLFLTESGWTSAESLQKHTVIQSGLTPSPNTLTAGFTDFIRRARNISLAAVSTFTDTLGSWPLAPYRLDAISITGTRIGPTTTLPIWSACLPESILESTRATGRDSPPLQESVLLSGTDQRPDVSGTVGTLRSPRAGKSGSVRTELARNVASYSKHLSEKAAIRRNFATPPARPLIIESVKRLPTREDVYDITVPDVEHFCLRNGAVVHNSHAADSFRYGCMGMAPAYEFKPLDLPKRVFV